MSEIIHTSQRGTVEIFEENGEKRICRTVNLTCPVYEKLIDAECPYIPQIYSVEIAVGKTVVTEEFISGKNLLAANLDEKQILRAMVQLCAVLDCIHGLCIVHRDIKPSNILIDEDGNIRLIDFEAARFVSSGKDKDTCYLGTDGFAPPEQYGFSQTDFRSDIYAAGQTMKILLGSLSAKPRYAKIIKKCTALDPDKRYQSAKTLANALENKREKIISVAVSAATVVLILVVFALREDSAENIFNESGIVSETEYLATTESAFETDTDDETTIADGMEAYAQTVITDENGYPLNLERYDIDIIKKYIARTEGGLTYYGIPENLPDYDRGDLLFFPPQEDEENTKILFTSGKALFKEHRRFYMYFDMDDDGVNEAISAEVDNLLNLDVNITYGLPDKTEGVFTGLKCFCSKYLTGYDYINIDENCFLQITCFKNPYDRKYVAVTIGDGKSFNVTEMYAVKNGAVEYVGSGWGETTAVMYDTGLNIYFDGGGQNLYLLLEGELLTLNEYDYEEYQKIAHGEYSLSEIHEKIARKPEGYE